MPRVSRKKILFLHSEYNSSAQIMLNKIPAKYFVSKLIQWDPKFAYEFFEAHDRLEWGLSVKKTKIQSVTFGITAISALLKLNYV